LPFGTKWKLWYAGKAKEFGIEPEQFAELIAAQIKDREEKARAKRAEEKLQEQRAERKRKTEVQEWKEKTFEELDSCFVEMAHLAVAKYRSPFMLLLGDLNSRRAATENARICFRCLPPGARQLVLARYAGSLLVALCIMLTSNIACAQGAYEDMNTAEGWAWSKLKSNELADFNQRCGTPTLDPKDEKDAQWQDNCRKLSAKFLQDLIAQSPWREATPQGAIGIMGAHIVGNLDLSDVTFNRGISISSSRIDGSFDFSRASTTSLIDLNDSVMNGKFSAAGLHSEGDVNLNGGMEFKDAVTLENARIAGTFDMSSSRYAGQVSLVGAKVGGSLILGFARFEQTLVAGAMDVGGHLVMWLSRFADANFSGSKIGGQVGINGSTFSGTFTAGLMQVGGNFSFAPTFAPMPEAPTRLKDVAFTGTKIAGSLILGGASFDGQFEATGLQVGGSLGIKSEKDKTNLNEMILQGAKIDGNLIIGKAVFNKLINLNDAKVGGKLDIFGSVFDEEFQANLLQVDGTFIISGDEENPTVLHKFWLNNAKIKGDFGILGVTVDKPIMATASQIGGNLGMGAPTEKLLKDTEEVTMTPYAGAHATAKFSNVILIGTGVDGNVFMNGSYQKIEAAGLRVAGGIHMQEAKLLDEVDLNMARIGGNLDLRSAHVAGPFYLSGAMIGGDLRLGGDRKTDSTVWDSQGSLHLRNAHIGNLMDAKDAWPQTGQLHVQGFPFGHLGGTSGGTGREMRDRDKGFWDKWARLDPDYSPLTYSQLAAVFVNEGERDVADDIRYLGREREREIACGKHLSGSCVLQSILGAVAGYGIGTYSFRVVYWVFLFWLIGLAVLWRTVPSARNRGFSWCCCASLAQLLPVIPMNKELTEFFVDPDRTRLKGWQLFFFSALGVIGLALGSILIIAVSGLTHST